MTMARSRLCGVAKLAYRACYLISLGIRYAYSRALHLADTSPDITEDQRELQVNIWHSICAVERLLSMLTGLPPSIQDQFISVRFPKATYHSNGPSVGHHGHLDTISVSGSRKGSPLSHQTTFVASLRLDSIVHETLTALYSPGTVSMTWARVQQTVLDLDKKLTHWQIDLTPGHLLLSNHDDPGRFHMNERMYLSFRFLSTKMLINRPSLCDVNELNAAIPCQSRASRRLDTDAAVRCISAARSLILLLPAQIDNAEFYRLTPWWCALHYLIQAGVILVTEIALDMQHMHTETESIVADSVLVVRWLHALSATNDSARRAYLSFDRLLKLALSKLGKRHGSNLSHSSGRSTPRAPPTLGLSLQYPSNDTNWSPAYHP